MRYFIAMSDSLGLISRVYAIEAKSVLAAKRQVNKIDDCYGETFICTNLADAFELDPDSLVALHLGKFRGCTWMDATAENKKYFKKRLDLVRERGITFVANSAKVINSDIHQ
jgi:hypothetical protein